MTIHTMTFRGHEFRVQEGSVHPAYSLAIFSEGGEEHDFREAHWRPEPGQFVVDIGASYGAYALTAAACGAKVLAFEPEPTVAVDLERNVALNPSLDVEVRRDALGSGEGEIDMREYAAHWPQQTISGPYKARTLDSFELGRCDLLKCDVEGFEVEVLKGAMATLKRCRPTCIIEVHEFIDAGLLQACVNLIGEAGYLNYSIIARPPCSMLIARPV